MKKLDVNVINAMKGIIGGMMSEEESKKYFLFTEGLYFKIENDLCSPVKFGLLKDKQTGHILSYSTEYYSLISSCKDWKKAENRYCKMSDFQTLKLGYTEMLNAVYPNYKEELKAVMRETSWLFNFGCAKQQFLPPTRECFRSRPFLVKIENICDIEQIFHPADPGENPDEWWIEYKERSEEIVIKI